MFNTKPDSWWGRFVASCALALAALWHKAREFAALVGVQGAKAKEGIQSRRWSTWLVIIGALALVGAFAPVFPDGVGGRTSYAPYIVRALGGLWQAAAGAFVFIVLIRHVGRLNLSAYTDERARAVAGAGLSVGAAIFGLAVALAV